MALAAVVASLLARRPILAAFASGATEAEIAAARTELTAAETELRAAQARLAALQGEQATAAQLAEAAQDLKNAEAQLVKTTASASARIPLVVLSSCFAARTPMLNQDEAKWIEEFRPGDLILSRSESDPDGPLVLKVVEAVFTRLGRIWELRVGGQVIRTTAEHPFGVFNRGWIKAGLLGVGDMLVSHDGQVKLVEDVRDTGEYETVYNVRVADHHTYFVGGPAWGFSVWRIMRSARYSPRKATSSS